MRKSHRLPVFYRLPVALIVMCLVFTASNFKVQAAPGDLGCLFVSSVGEYGQFDLTRGVYTDISSIVKPFGARSPDGKHLSYVDDESQQIVIVYGTGKTEQVYKLPPSSSSSYWPEWSPDSRFVAHRVKLEDVTGLIIVSVDGKGQQQFTIASLGVDAPPILLWSPDSRYIAVAVDASFLRKSAFTETAINLYGVDGSVWQHVAEHAVGYLSCGEVCDQNYSFEWSGDGHSLLYVQFAPGSGLQLDLSDTQFDVMAYRLDEQRNVTLAKNVSDFPVYRLDHEFGLVQWHSGDVTNAAVLDVQKAATLTLDSRSSPVDLKWLGNTALVRWDARLIWSQADGTSKHQLDVAPAQLVNGPTTVAFDETAAYEWSRNERWLVMMTESDDPGSDIKQPAVWVIDLVTGKTRTFSDLGVAFTIDARFLSPDGRVAVLLGEELYVLYLPGGKPIKVKLDPSEPLYELHQFVWSPDNTMFAVVFSYERTGLYLVRRDGTVLRYYQHFMPWSSDPPLWWVSWSKCR